MIIKLFKELGRRMDKQSEKLEILTNVKNLNKLENVKKRNQTAEKKVYQKKSTEYQMVQRNNSELGNREGEITRTEQK